MTDPDVVVVGAGPAGSIGALVLARAGVRVLLIDRSAFPRHKLCGDTLNPGTLAMLDRFGLGDAVRRAAIPIGGMVVSGPDGTSVHGDYPADCRGAAISRNDLDAILVNAAIAAGAMFVGQTLVRGPVLDDAGRVVGVRCRADGRERIVRAQLVIAADGRHSRIAFQLGLARFAEPRRWAFGAYFDSVDAMSHRGEMHVREDGYIGLSPLPGGLTNVCVVRKAASAMRMTPDPVARLVDADRWLRHRFGSARQVTRTTVLGPLGVTASSAGRPGLLLAGDAGGFVDPMTGDGLRFAVRGGELAALAAIGELSLQRGGRVARHGEAHRVLAEMRRREFTAKWALNRSLRWLTATPAALNAAARVAAVWQAPFGRLIRIAGDCGLVRM